MADDTIFAVSSGRPPAAIAVMRISGPGAHPALARLVGSVPAAREATVRTVRSDGGDILDRALILWFPGPRSATGEDVAELHLHGGIAVIAAVSRALEAIGLRHAEPGEFTRRAVLNGRLDLNEAEGLADLLAAETEAQRREAVLRATGAFSREIEGWTGRLLAAAAAIERTLDYDDEDHGAPRDLATSLLTLRDEIAGVLSRPGAERLRDGIRVAIVGPVNAGKSTLFNALVCSDAAIVSSIAGTTRDAIERTVSLDGVPFLFTDTAGIRETDDPVERIGIDRARSAESLADIVIDLSDGARSAAHRIAIHAKADLGGDRGDEIAVSAVSGAGMASLRGLLRDRAETLLPREREVALNARQRAGLDIVAGSLARAAQEDDLVIVAEHLRIALRALDLLTGRAGVEDLLDTLFSRFCLGK